MITQNISKDDVEFQRSEILSDLWRDLANNEKTGEFIIHDRCVYQVYDPIEGETYMIVPTIRGRWFMIKPLSMRDLARTFASIQPKYSGVVIDHIDKCKSVVNQCFRAMNEKQEEIDINGTTMEPRDIHDKNYHTCWSPTKRQRSAIKGKNNPFR